jgi:hypothetical protein
LGLRIPRLLLTACRDSSITGSGFLPVGGALRITRPLRKPVAVHLALSARSNHA